MTWLLIAGGVYFAQPTVVLPEVKLINHTLAGEVIPAKDVVCRNRWGTPMLPDGKGSYSLIAPINEGFIALSLFQPPKVTAGDTFPGIPFKAGPSLASTAKKVLDTATVTDTPALQ